MEALEIKTRKKNQDWKYSQNVEASTVFLRHSEDRITTINQEVVQIEVYENGNLIFIGDKYDFYNQLKK